jgi:hypothetical protein
MFEICKLAKLFYGWIDTRVGHALYRRDIISIRSSNDFTEDGDIVELRLERQR